VIALDTKAMSTAVDLIATCPSLRSLDMLYSPSPTRHHRHIVTRRNSVVPIVHGKLAVKKRKTKKGRLRSQPRFPQNDDYIAAMVTVIVSL
jgi:hypothetical protein